jgi:hypothetical protein
VTRKSKDQKLSSQLNDINKLLKAKADEGGKGGIAGGMQLFKNRGGGKGWQEDEGEGGGKRRKV